MLFLTILFAVASCDQKTQDGSSGNQVPVSSSLVLSTIGPRGEAPVPADIVKISDRQRQKIRNKGVSVAIVMHSASDFTSAVIAGVENITHQLNLRIIHQSTADMHWATQKKDLEVAIAKKPDILITLIIDPNGSRELLETAIKKNIKLVFLSNVPNQFVHGKHDSGVVTDDLFGMGEAVAEMIANNPQNKKKVVLMYHDAEYYVTNQRDQAVKTILKLRHPDMEILGEVGIKDISKADRTTAKLLKEYPEVEVIYAPWDTIAMGVIDTLQRQKRGDVLVYTMDLGIKNAINLLLNRNLAGIVSDMPVVIGETLAKVGALATINATTPPFVITPVIKISKENILNEWPNILNQPVPDPILDAINLENE